MSGKNIAIIGVASLILVAMVIGVAIGFHKKDDGSKKDNISATRKAIENICQPTDYKETCVKTIEKGSPASSDPKDLVKAAFNVALKAINNVSEHSTLLKELEKDPKTAKAVESCRSLFRDAANDFRRSVDEISRFDLTHLDTILVNLKIWLSATVTYQQTCLDGFIDANSDAVMKVRKLLNLTMQMSSNGLFIVQGIQSALGDLQSQIGQNRAPRSEPSRRLLSSSKAHGSSVRDDDHDEVAVPRWMESDHHMRRLLQAKTIDEMKPNVVVALDGSGMYRSIREAYMNAPKKNKVPYVIHVKEGVYHEHLYLDKRYNVVLVGDGPTKTRITGDLYYGENNMTTVQTFTLTVKSGMFLARDIGIENTAGAAKHQAVALMVQADKSVFYNVHVDGYQDTLYAHTYRQYYRDCRISGTIDFIFGDAAAFFENCTIVVRKPLDNQACIVTAHGRTERTAPTGFIFHKSKIVADPDYFPVRFTNKAYLGRPWKPFSKTIYMECHFDDLVSPEGWQAWSGSFGLDTCYYGEYKNEGPGSNTEHRVKWRGIKTIFPSRAEKFMPLAYFEEDDWITNTRVPYERALTSDPSTFVAPPGAIDEIPDDPSKVPLSDIKGRYGHKKKKPRNGKAPAPAPSIGSSQAPSPQPLPATPTISTNAPINNTGMSPLPTPTALVPPNDQHMVSTGYRQPPPSSTSPPQPTPSLSNAPSDQNSTSEASLSSPPSDQNSSIEARPPQPTPTLSNAPNDQNSSSEASLSSPPSDQNSSSEASLSSLPSDQSSPSSEAAPQPQPTPSLSNVPNDQDSTAVPQPIPSLSTIPGDQNPQSRTNLLETTLKMNNNKRSLLSESSASKGVDETPSNTPVNGPLLMGSLKPEELAPTSASISESPNSSTAVKLDRSLFEDDAPIDAQSESSSSVDNLGRMPVQTDRI